MELINCIFITYNGTTYNLQVCVSSLLNPFIFMALNAVLIFMENGN